MAMVFTLFNHGTAFDRDKDENEVVTLLHDAVAGHEARIVKAEPTPANPSGFRLERDNPSYLICEGPGSGAVTAEASRHGVAHTRPGVRNPMLDTAKDSTSWNPFGASENPFIPERPWRRPWATRPPAERLSDFRKEFLGETPSNTQTTGLMLGKGWDDNVYRAVWMLSHLKFERGMPIDTVNMVGWSRGAVTCIKQANKLHEVFGTKLTVNIFAIDPVPGGWNERTEDLRIIPPNVRDMLVILATDDDRGNFQPLDLNELRVACPRNRHAVAPNVHFLPLPGGHGDVVFPTKGAAPQSGKLCLYLAHRFLQAHGTRFRRPPTHSSLAPQELLRLYTELLNGRERIKREAACKWNDVAAGSRKERKVRQTLAEYVSEPLAYINEHHRLCAQAPAVGRPVEPPREQRAPGEPYRPTQGSLRLMGVV